MHFCKSPRATILAGLLAAIVSAAGAQDRVAPFTHARSGDPDGRTVVLIPGLASSGAVWTDTTTALGDYDVHTLTLAGFGGAPPRTDGAPVIAGAAEAVAAVLRADDVRDAAIVGHSLGAQVALQVAALVPDRVSQVVVVDSAPFYAGLVQPGVAPEQAAAFAHAVQTQLRAVSDDAFRAQQAAGLGMYTRDPAFVATLVEWSSSSDRETIIGGFGEVAGGDFRSVLPRVQADVLVIAAWHAGMPVPREALEAAYNAQYAGTPRARVTVIDDAAHFVMHDQQDAFLAALTSFLKEGR